MKKPKVVVTLNNLWNTVDVDVINHNESDGITPSIHSLITRDNHRDDTLQFIVRLNALGFVNLLSEQDIDILLALISERIGREKACSIINQHWNEIEEAQEEEEHGEY